MPLFARSNANIATGAEKYSELFSDDDSTPSSLAPSSNPVSYQNPPQPWVSFSCEVIPVTGPQSHPRWLPLLTDITPWRGYIDFTSIDSSDVFIIQTEISVHAPSSIPRYTKDESGHIWLLDDRLTISLRKVKPGDPDSIHINDSPVSYNKILSIEPLSGPWVARLAIAQIQGMSKPLRFMRL